MRTKKCKSQSQKQSRGEDKNLQIRMEKSSTNKRLTDGDG